RLAAEEPSPPFIERLEEQPAGGHPRILSDFEEPIEQWRLVPNFRDDRKSFPSQIWADVQSLTSWHSVGWRAAGSGFAAYSDRNWDDDVRRRTAAHPRRWGGFNNVFDVVGHPATHLTAAGVYYGVSLALDDVEGWQFSRAMLHSLILTDVS